MFVSVGGYQVHTAGFGSGDPTIVFIPGGFAPWEIWQPTMELLSASHRVVSFDHYGSGLTMVPESMVQFEHQVGLVEALLDHWDLSSLVLVGDSNNVALAVEVALRHPDRVTALGLVAGGVRHARSPDVDRFAAGLRSDFDRTLDWFVRFCIPEAGQEAAAVHLAALIRRTGGQRAAVLLESYYGIDLSDRLPELAMPTLVLQGGLDQTPSTRGTAHAMASAIPDCTLELLEDAGHVPMLTRPQEVAASLERLVERSE